MKTYNQDVGALDALVTIAFRPARGTTLLETVCIWMRMRRIVKFMGGYGLSKGPWILSFYTIAKGTLHIALSTMSNFSLSNSRSIQSKIETYY
jgi:hypothetical protein